VDGNSDTNRKSDKQPYDAHDAKSDKTVMDAFPPHHSDKRMDSDSLGNVISADVNSFKHLIGTYQSGQRDTHLTQLNKGTFSESLCLSHLTGKTN